MRSADRTQRDARGAAAVVVAIVILLLASITAVVINVGHMMAVRAQLQNATDSAALAGAAELDGTIDGLAAARASAVDYAARHQTDRAVPVGIDPTADVVLGHWNFSLPRDEAFTETTGTTPEELNRTNAVRVLAGRESARGNPVQVFFAGLFTTRAADVRAQSVAVKGGPCDEGCAVPIVFADCQIFREDRSLRCDEPLVFNSDGTDNIGFTNLTQSPTVSTDALRDILHGSCKAVKAGDLVGVANGTNLSPLFGEFAALVGKEVSAPIVSFGGGCPAKFNEHPEGAPIVGFATFTITGVAAAGSVAGTCPMEIVPGMKALCIELECDQVSKTPAAGGCDFFGTGAPRPRLVR